MCMNKALHQWHIYGRVHQSMGPPPKCLLCPTTEIEKYQDTLIEQSNILIKVSRPGCALPTYGVWLRHCTTHMYFIGNNIHRSHDLDFKDTKL